MNKTETLYWLLQEFDPGNHNEDFANEAAMIIELGLDVESAINLIASRTSYVAGSNVEFEFRLADIIGG